MAEDGVGGISLMSARVGWLSGWFIAIAAYAPALVLGVASSARGNPLTGIFTAASSLAVLAAAGGPTEQWLYIKADTYNALPGAFTGLIVETMLWQVPLVAMIVVIGRTRDPLRRRFKALVRDDHFGTQMKWRRLPNRRATGAGLVCAAVAAVSAYFLLQTTQTAQVVVGLFVAFVFGGLLGQLFFPQRNAVAMLFSPAIVAVVAYVFVLLRFDTSSQMLAATWDEQLTGAANMPGPALALPIHYASSALAGVAVGIGWAQAILATNNQSDEPT